VTPQTEKERIEEVIRYHQDRMLREMDGMGLPVLEDPPPTGLRWGWITAVALGVTLGIYLAEWLVCGLACIPKGPPEL
jgi:hypothetical protein